MARDVTTAGVRFVRVTALVAAFALGLGACTAAPVADEAPTPVVDDRGVRFRALREAIAAVADAQASADAPVDMALDAARAVDVSVSRFLDPATLYEEGESWPTTRAVVDSAGFTDLREPYFEVVLATDRARAALGRAEEATSGDWEQRYLAAQEEVLAAVRTYAEAADRVAQLLERHGSTYVAVAELNSSFTERRFFFRDAEEAADAYATEVDTLLDDLVTAQTQLVDTVADRRDAALALNDASATAREVYADRPDGSG